MSSKSKTVAAPAKTAAKGKSTSTTAAAKKENYRTELSHLFAPAKKDFRIGRGIAPKRDLSRYVKWPRYIRLQRQKAIINKRLKVPPSIAQFTRTLDKNQATNLFRLLSHYRPESAEDKKIRLTAAAEAEVKKQEVKTAKPVVVKFGLNHVTQLVESKKAKLVVIAHDVDPIELVLWLPALCRKLNVPYCIVKNKARLGHLVYQKNASVVALTDVRKEDQAKLDQIVSSVTLQYNDDVAHRKKWGGGIMGFKAQAVQKQRDRIAAKEALLKATA